LNNHASNFTSKILDGSSPRKGSTKLNANNDLIEKLLKGRTTYCFSRKSPHLIEARQEVDGTIMTFMEDFSHFIC